MKRTLQGIALAAVLMGPLALDPLAAHADGPADQSALNRMPVSVLTSQVAGGTSINPAIPGNRLLNTPAGLASLRPDLITLVRDTGSTFVGLSDTVDISVRNTGALPAANIET